MFPKTVRFLIMAIMAMVLAQPALAAGSAYDYAFESIDGDAIKLGDHSGKVLLVVNTATQCGNTHQFGTLQKAWETYRDQGLMVVGVSSNDFGQEPRAGDAIKDFCSTNYSVDYPMADLTHVRGNDAHPFFKWVEAELGEKGTPSWNFFKYLIGRDGQIIDYFGTVEDPMDKRMRSAIEAALK